MASPVAGDYMCWKYLKSGLHKGKTTVDSHSLFLTKTKKRVIFGQNVRDSISSKSCFTLNLLSLKRFFSRGTEWFQLTRASMVQCTYASKQAPSSFTLVLTGVRSLGSMWRISVRGYGRMWVTYFLRLCLRVILRTVHFRPRTPKGTCH